MHIRSLLLSFVLLIHLQATAGELININTTQPLKPTITIQLTSEQAYYLKRTGLDNANKYTGLYLVTNDKPADIAVACQYVLNGNNLSYTPIYPLGYGLDFEVQYKNGHNIIITEQFRTPGHPLSKIKSKVVTAYPICDTIPFNTLFFHVRFSQKMANDNKAYQYIKVYEENGVERPRAWRQRSFWLDSGRILVLMIHPGRVKNGIHYESPLFDSGKYYNIVVGREIKDVNGNPIAQEYTKSYFVKGIDKVSPKLNFHKLTQPSVNTNNSILISFSEGMDNSSVLDGTKVYDANGKEIPCIVREYETDRVYRVTPVNKWEKGTYTLSFKSSVYDFCANRINRLFEITDAKEVETDKNRLEFQFQVR